MQMKVLVAGNVAATEFAIVAAEQVRNTDVNVVVAVALVAVACVVKV